MYCGVVAVSYIAVVVVTGGGTLLFPLQGWSANEMVVNKYMEPRKNYTHRRLYWLN